jgi:starch synthase (maltosyl-transferring)
MSRSSMAARSIWIRRNTRLRQRSFQDLDGPDSLRGFITLVNHIRQRHPGVAIRSWNLHIHPVDNGQILCYSKAIAGCADVILVVVNLDPNYTQAGCTDLNLEALGVKPSEPFQVHDLLTGAHYTSGTDRATMWN